MRKPLGIVTGLLCLILAGLTLGVSGASALTASDFADWTSVTDNVGPAPDVANGTLHGTAISLTGNVQAVTAFDSNTSGTYTGFNDPAFTPPLPSSDVVAIGTSGSPFFLQFGSAVTNPEFHVSNLGGSSGSHDATVPGGHADHQGERKHHGVGPSGRGRRPRRGKGHLQAGRHVQLDLVRGEVHHVRSEQRLRRGDLPPGRCARPAPAQTPGRTAAAPAASGSSCPAGNSAGVSCQGGGTTVTGTSGNDKIVAPPGAKVVKGGGGNDTIDCRISKATCEGGEGKDSLKCNASQARCDGGSGNDKLDCKSTKGRLHRGQWPGQPELPEGAGEDRLRRWHRQRQARLQGHEGRVHGG